jgi:hypothetical protein
MPLCQEMFLNKSKKILRLSHNKKNVDKNAPVIRIDEIIWIVCAESNKIENVISFILEFYPFYNKEEIVDKKLIQVKNLAKKQIKALENY